MVGSNRLCLVHRIAVTFERGRLSFYLVKSSTFTPIDSSFAFNNRAIRETMERDKESARD